jgi:2-polyprenyl-3-methyl-5-hydroxy-6-metoxy-1,4-benzoquinol methylase
VPVMNAKRLRGALRAVMPHVAPTFVRTLRYPKGPAEAVEGWKVDASVWKSRGQMASDILRCMSASDELRKEQGRFGKIYGRDALEFLRVGLWWHGVRFSMVAELTAGYASWLASGPGAAPFSVLEVGCNVGLMSMAIKQRLPHAEVVGVDLQQRVIDIAQWFEAVLGKHGVRWVVGDGRSLEQQFAPQKFDVVYLCEILEHYDDASVHHDLLQQACAVCKPGGWVFVSVPFEGRIPIAGHKTEFDQDSLDALIRPFAARTLWFAEERLRFKLDNHFFLAFQPRV